MNPLRRFSLSFAVAASLAVAAATASSDPSLVDQARAALARGDTDAAITLLEKAVEQTPRNAEAHFVLASAYGIKAQDGGMLGGMKFGM